MRSELRKKLPKMASSRRIADAGRRSTRGSGADRLRLCACCQCDSSVRARACAVLVPVHRLVAVRLRLLRNGTRRLRRLSNKLVADLHESLHLGAVVTLQRLPWHCCNGYIGNVIASAARARKKNAGTQGRSGPTALAQRLGAGELSTDDTEFYHLYSVRYISVKILNQNFTAFCIDLDTKVCKKSASFRLTDDIWKPLTYCKLDAV